MPATELSADLLADFGPYAFAFWWLTAKNGQQVRFLPNVAQRVVLSAVERQEQAGRPVRLVIVKARQQGISTFLTALLQHRCQTRPGHRAISLADRLELPRLWLRRATLWHSQTPAPVRPRLAASNAIELFFEDIDSRYSIGSESGVQPGMGMTLQDAHLSEVSNWRNYRAVASKLLPAIPQTPGTLVALESTGELEGDDFYEQVMRAVEHDSDFELVFLPFWLTPEYRMPGVLDASEYMDDERELIEVGAKWLAANPDVARLAQFDGLTPEHLLWRRWVTANEFGGDADLFRSRYPARLSDAFLSVGSLALPISIIRHHAATAHEPIAVGRLEWNDQGEVEWVDDPDGAWSIYEPGYEYCEYCIGGDVAEGKVSDPEDDRSERDWSTQVVLNRRTLATTATFRARIEPDAYGREMVKAGRFWNDAWVSPEANSAGMAALAVLRDYPHLMAREGTPDQLQDRALDRLGWRTTPQNRNQLIDEWIAVCHPDMRGDYEGRVHCLCPLLAGEERTFVRTGTGKREHRPGCHDDVLFGAMIAYQVHQRCPHVRRSPETVRRGEVLAAVADRLVRDDRFAGGVDVDALDDEPTEGEWRIE